MLGFPGSSFSGADVEFMLIPSGGSVLVYFPTLPGSVLDSSCLYPSELSVLSPGALGKKGQKCQVGSVMPQRAFSSSN